MLFYDGNLVFGAESDSYADADADCKHFFTHPWTCVCQLVNPQDNLVDLIDLFSSKVSENIFVDKFFFKECNWFW